MYSKGNVGALLVLFASTITDHALAVSCNDPGPAAVQVPAQASVALAFTRQQGESSNIIICTKEPGQSVWVQVQKLGTEGSHQLPTILAKQTSYLLKVNGEINIAGRVWFFPKVEPDFKSTSPLHAYFNFYQHPDSADWDTQIEVRASQ